MVLPRRNSRGAHRRLASRNVPVQQSNFCPRLAGFVSILGIGLYLLYVLGCHIFSNQGGKESGSISTSASSFLEAGGAGAGKLGVAGEGGSRWWRHLGRDFDAEYRDVLQVYPALKATRQARIAFLIMANGPNDVDLLKRMLPWLYSPLNFFLVHMDRKSSDEDREAVQQLLEGLDNARMLEPALSVSWGGFSITLTALFGLSTLVEWSDEWDYFINLSASDFPLMTAAEMAAALGTFVSSRVNFVTGLAMVEQNRAELYVDDQGLYRSNVTRQAAKPFFEKDGSRVGRPLPNLFHLFKGEFWVTLHRDFCEYIHESPDNVARSLQAYFAKFRISDESFFQTTLCHPEAPSEFPVHNDNLRLINWPYFDPETEWVLHPEPVLEKHVPKLMNSGAMFARKFDLGLSDRAVSKIETILSRKGQASKDRLDRVLHRGRPARSVRGREEFCALPKGYSLDYVLRHQKEKVERKPNNGKR